MSDVTPRDEGAAASRAPATAPTARPPFAGVASRYLSVIVLCAVMLLTPVVVRLAADRLWPPRGAPSYLPALEKARQRAPFDRRPIRHLRARKPRFVFLGDSMLGSRIDADYLESLLPDGTRVARMQRHATGSAYWWLALKNWIVRSGIQPRRVFVFFRDDNLTDPLFRLTGGPRLRVDSAARDFEPELNEAVAQRLNGTWHRFHAAIDDAYDDDRLGTAAERSVSHLAVWLTAPHEDPDRFLEKVNRVFALNRLRGEQRADIDDSGLTGRPFDAELASSLLPQMLRLAGQSRIQLAFVRVQRRPGRDGVVHQPQALLAYMNHLRNYIESNGATLIDFTGDPAVPVSWYGNGDHIARQHRRDWTALFHRRAAHLLR